MWRAFSHSMVAKTFVRFCCQPERFVFQRGHLRSFSNTTLLKYFSMVSR